MGNSSSPSQGDRTEHERLGMVKLEAKPLNPSEDEDETFFMHLDKTV